MATLRLCSIPDCGKPVIAKGYCTKHYQRLMRCGDPNKTHRYEGQICSVNGCNNVAKARGVCRAHYWRLRIHGDALAGRTPEGTALKFLNDVVMPYQGEDCLEWPYSHNGAGYPIIWLEGRQQLATRVVCERVNGPAPTQEHEAAHTCGNGHLKCINPKHMQWETPSENQLDRVKHDTHMRGERHPLSKLTEDDVREIRRLKETRTQQQIADAFGIGRVQVSRILSGERWGWLRD